MYISTEEFKQLAFEYLDELKQYGATPKEIGREASAITSFLEFIKENVEDFGNASV